MKTADRIYKTISVLYRLFVGYAIFCIICGLFIVFNPNLKKAEEDERERLIKSESFRRGDILSSDRKPLAIYYPEYMLFTDFGVRIGKNYTIDRQKVSADEKNPVKLDTLRIHIYKEFAQTLSKSVGGNADDYYKELYGYRVKAEDEKKNDKTGEKEWFTRNILKDKINVFQRDMIVENPYLKQRGRNVTGIYTKEMGKREYPYGDDFAHSAIGIIREKTVSGIENMYNAELKNGDNILTTIDIRMQDICETALQNAIFGDKRLVGGTVILMEVETGDIKAIANTGAYYQDYYSDIRDKYNNATKATIEPGSTFKTVSLMLALETGKVSFSEKFNTKIWRDNKQFTEKNELDSFLTVSRIIENSSNIGTGNMIDKAFDRNIDKFIQAIKALKITHKIEKMDEIRPSINQNSNKETMLKLSHGYQIKLAPVHILSFYNAIANNGIMMKPRLVQGIVSRRTGSTKIFEPEIINKAICSKSTLDSVRLALSRVVGWGNARRIAKSPYGIAGKTGTARMWLENVKNYETPDSSSRDLSSFCGYFPEKKPKYSCIVALYTKLLTKSEMKNFYAGSTAAPLFRKISDRIYALYCDRDFVPADVSTNIPVIKNTRSENLSVISKKLDLPLSVDSDTWIKVNTVNKKMQVSELPLKRGIVPDVTGMGLRDAVFLLENRGFRVSYTGIGTVVKQSPEQGVTYGSGQKIHLTLSTN
ncbi:MAG: PASTA domain-containing protein [Prevotellaceae bacterium]|jgi:cell division protein FtsI (penicillin-binding protein 3)|nr:PASTA domain-containing protein [Prevotellaceae bacterium]